MKKKFKIDFTIMGSISIEAETESEARRQFQTKTGEALCNSQVENAIDITSGNDEDQEEYRNNNNVIDIIMEDIQEEPDSK